jgi:hypothetical protein
MNDRDSMLSTYKPVLASHRYNHPNGRTEV